MTTLLTCGSNGSGQLAIGHADDVSTFTPCHFDPSCPQIAHVLDVVSAASHALALVRDPEGRTHLLGAGTNTHGQLGKQCSLAECSRANTSFRPISIARDSGFEDWTPVKIAATWTTSFVTFEFGAGVGGSSSANVPNASSHEGLKTQVIVATGSNDFGELGGDGVIRLKAGEQVEHLRGGQRHVLAVVTTESGPSRKQRVLGWGASRRGELDPTSAHMSDKGKAKARPRTLPPTEITLDLPTPITDVSLGASHTLLLLANGSVVAWGNNLKGQVAGLDSTVGARAIGATWNGSYVLTDKLWSQGSNTHGQLLRPSSSDPETRPETRFPVPLDGTVASFAAGSEHILALVSSHGCTDLELWSGGWNEHGNLGLGNTSNQAELGNTNIKAQRVWAGCAASWALVE